jgi:hypothetical protein
MTFIISIVFNLTWAVQIPKCVVYSFHGQNYNIEHNYNYYAINYTYNFFHEYLTCNACNIIMHDYSIYFS